MKPLVQNIYPYVLAIANQHNVELDEIDYVLEHGMRILRVIVDSEEAIDIDLITIISEQISDKLDEIDMINEEYYLEVSSAGLEKELKTTNDLIKACGKYIYFTTYEKIIIGKTGYKEIYGDLVAVNDKEIIVKAQIKQYIKEITVPRQLIARARLAVRF